MPTGNLLIDLLLFVFYSKIIFLKGKINMILRLNYIIYYIIDLSEVTLNIIQINWIRAVQHYKNYIYVYEIKRKRRIGIEKEINFLFLSFSNNKSQYHVYADICYFCKKCYLQDQHFLMSRITCYPVTYHER